MRRRRTRYGKPSYANRLIGVNYVFMNLPFIVIGKVGFSSLWSGVKKRAASTSKAAPGILIPIMICPLPFPWHVEQFMHWLIADCKVSYYKGDGHTEAVNIFGYGLAWLIYFSINLIYIEIAHRYGFLPFGAFDVLEFIFGVLNQLRKIV